MKSVLFEKLNENNYEDWAPKMEALLEKDLWEVVSGELKAPAPKIVKSRSPASAKGKTRSMTKAQASTSTQADGDTTTPSTAAAAPATPADISLSQDAPESLVTIQEPPEKAVKAFLKKQRLAKASIVLCVENTQLPHIRYNDPKKIWDELKRIHRSRGFGTLLAMRRKFFSMVKTSEESMATWIASVRYVALTNED